MSDIEMGAGGITDDFPQPEFLAQVIHRYSRYPHDLRISLIFNGDTFDHLKVSIDGHYPHAIDEDIALNKTTRILKTHHVVFEALAHFLAQAPNTRAVYFIPGNHDLELLFPAVQQAIAGAIGDVGAVIFPGLSLQIGEVLIEHGNQEDKLFRIDPEQPFIDHDGREILNLPWGSVALLESILPYHPQLYHYDRIKPRREVLEHLPQMKKFLNTVAWRYWMRDYLRGYFRKTDPLKRFTWSIFKEVFLRMLLQDTDVSIREPYRKKLQQTQDYRVVVIGHEHEPYWWNHGDRKLLQTGCFRNEFILVPHPDGEPRQRLLPKALAEIWMRDDHALCSQLIELESPPPPAGFVPESIFSIIPIIEQLLESRESYEERQAAWLKQEAKEARPQRAKLTKHPKSTKPPLTPQDKETSTPREKRAQSAQLSRKPK
jgi:UDP-2,3-diacylglucosamine pyrophosphatase LpxH